MAVQKGKDHGSDQTMIYALSTKRSAFGMGDFLKTDGRAVSRLITMLSYEEVFAAGALPVGSYLFMGLDQVTPTEMALINRAHHTLAEVSPSARRLNHPGHWRCRGDLLRAAWDAGVNAFRVTRVSERGARRFPVFLRSEPEHTGNISPLIHDEAALALAVMRALLLGYRLRDLLVVEYCHTADDDGVFTKYSAMILGDEIVPRSLTRNQNWMTKFEGRLTDRASAEADLAYVRDNPHEAWCRRMFALAGVQYGRIDYALFDGRPQLWEINTNPTIGANLAYADSVTTIAASAAGPEGEELRLMERGNLLFYEKWGAAIKRLASFTQAALAADGAYREPVPLVVSSTEKRRLRRERAERERILGHRTALGRLAAPLRIAYRRWKPPVSPADEQRRIPLGMRRLTS